MLFFGGGSPTITLTGDVTGTGSGSITTDIAAGVVGSTEITNGSVTNTDLSSGTGGIFKGSGPLTGHTTITGGSFDLLADGLRNWRANGTSSLGSIPYRFGVFNDLTAGTTLRYIGYYANGYISAWNNSASLFRVGAFSEGSGLSRFFEWGTSNILINNYGTGATGFQGLVYAADNSASYVTRSLVDKGYVDGAITTGVAAAKYQTMRDDGTNKTQRAALNFTSTSTVNAVLTDDSGNNETEVAMNVPANGITATEIAAGAVTMAKINQAGATTGQVIKWDGAAWAPDDDATGGGGSGGHVILDDGTPENARDSLDFIDGTDIEFTITDNAGAGKTEVRANLATGAVDLNEMNVIAGNSLLGNATSGTNSVDEVGAGFGLEFDGVDKIGVDTALVATQSALRDTAAAIRADFPAGGGGVTGSGTTNKIPIWSSSTALGNSWLSQSGTTISADTDKSMLIQGTGNLAIGTSSSTVPFYITRDAPASGYFSQMVIEPVSTGANGYSFFSLNSKQTSTQNWILGTGASTSGGYQKFRLVDGSHSYNNKIIADDTRIGIGYSCNINTWGTTQTICTYYNGSNDYVGIKQSTPIFVFDINSTDAIRIPVGTTAQRPASPANGIIRYNSSKGTFDGYHSGGWNSLGSYLIGEGATSSTWAWQAYNSTPTFLAGVRNDGKFSIGTATPGTNSLLTVASNPQTTLGTVVIESDASMTGKDGYVMQYNETAGEFQATEYTKRYLQAEESSSPNDTFNLSSTAFKVLDNLDFDYVGDWTTSAGVATYGDRTNYYLITFSASAELDAGDVDLSFGIYKNDTTATQAQSTVYCATGGKKYTLSGSAVVQLADTNTIRVKAKVSAGSLQMTLHEFSLTITEI